MFARSYLSIPNHWPQHHTAATRRSSAILHAQRIFWSYVLYHTDIVYLAWVGYIVECWYLQFYIPMSALHAHVVYLRPVSLVAAPLPRCPQPCPSGGQCPHWAAWHSLGRGKWCCDITGHRNTPRPIFGWNRSSKIAVLGASFYHVCGWFVWDEDMERVESEELPSSVLSRSESRWWLVLQKGDE